MADLLGSVFYSNRKHREPKHNPLFDSLQLVFSHMLLFSNGHVASSREYYDIESVYNWRKPFSTLYSRQQPGANEDHHQGEEYEENLSDSGPQFQVDRHALLHIRNFWHRHLGDSTSRRRTGFDDEKTYAKMVMWLKRDRVPLPAAWTRALTEPLNFATRWVGHYSCIHPYPRRPSELEENQTCAAKWTGVDPLVRDSFILFLLTKH